MGVDPTGRFWKEIWDYITSFFGAKYSVETVERKTPPSFGPNEYPAYVQHEHETTTTITESGDDSKPISVYATIDSQNPATSSDIGVKLNAGNVATSVNIACDDLSLNFSACPVTICLSSS